VIIKTFPDIKSAWEGIYFSFLDDKPGVIDNFSRNIVHSHNNHIIAKSGVMDFDLGEIGLTQTKWTKFTGQYVDVESLHAWVNNAMNVKTYDALWQFKSVPPNFSGQKAVHQWGSCLLGFSFRRQPKPSTLTFFTRAQSIGFSGVADYALCSFVIGKLAQRMGVDPSSIKLQIYCPNFILKTVETVHFLHQRGLLEEYTSRGDRIGSSIQYYIDYMNRPEEEIKWRAARRMKKKYENSQADVFKPLPVSGLTLKGWHYEGAQNRKLSARDSARLVLSGVGRRGSEVVDIDDDEEIA
jgi:hypothetical protein